MAMQRQLKALSEMGPDRAVAAIEHSIRNGWQGIFEQNPPKVTQANSANPADINPLTGELWVQKTGAEIDKIMESIGRGKTS